MFNIDNLTAKQLFSECESLNNYSLIEKLRNIVSDCDELKKQIKPLESPIIKSFSEKFPNIGIISGSAALHGYMLSIKKIPTWHPNDIDIWIPIDGLTPTLRKLYSIKNNLYIDKNNNSLEIFKLILDDPIIKKFIRLKSDINKYFVNYGYKFVPNKEEKIIDYPNTNIVTVYNFESSTSEYKIQVIFTSQVNDMYDIVNTFDIDCVKVIYDITKKEFLVKNDIKNIINNQLMYVNEKSLKKADKLNPRYEGRVKKYAERGFNMLKTNDGLVRPWS
jgi:hypothetical protein